MNRAGVKQTFLRTPNPILYCSTLFFVSFPNSQPLPHSYSRLLYTYIYTRVCVWILWIFEGIRKPTVKSTPRETARESLCSPALNERSADFYVSRKETLPEMILRREQRCLRNRNEHISMYLFFNTQRWDKAKIPLPWAGRIIFLF